MKRTIVLVSHTGLDGWWRETILRRMDFEVHPVTGYAEALQTVLQTPCDLLVAEEWPGAALFHTFLAEVRSSFRSASLKAILVTNSLSPGQLPPPFDTVLPNPCSVGEFNTAVVSVLDLLPRSSRRYLLRLHTQIGEGESRDLGVAVTLEVNAGGMVVEATRPLPVGKTLLWTFLGSGELKGIRIPGVILKPQSVHGMEKVHRYIVRFSESAVHERERISAFLSLRG